ncbi:hypothetical protein L218DRAFT_863105 [Marasmius fiardii PR-910]|nr:hypothetical protein L218DRAFT_863105 [Marasmius fiardii PR-910]
MLSITTAPCSAHDATSVTPQSSKQFDSTGSSCSFHSAPQCCHCGWRGSHSPTCPFK